MKQIYTSDITERNRDMTNYEQDNDWEDYDDDDLDEYPSRSVMRRVEIMKNRKEN